MTDRRRPWLKPDVSHYKAVKHGQHYEIIAVKPNGDYDTVAGTANDKRTARLFASAEELLSYAKTVAGFAYATNNPGALPTAFQWLMETAKYIETGGMPNPGD